MAKKTTKKVAKHQLIVRQASTKDINDIKKLADKVYPEMGTYPSEMLLGQINNYPEGHFVAVLDDKIVGYCASIRLSEKKVMLPHTWREITGGGYGSTHEAKGDYLYGYEVFVDTDVRGYKIGQRFYNERKKLAKYLRLKGIVFAGRIPNYKKHQKKVGNPENYIQMVEEKKLRDPVLSFQLRNGFEVLGVLDNYLPYDLASQGYAVHMIWRNPEAYVEENHILNRSHSNMVRVASVQYEQRGIQSFKEFETLVTHFVDICSDYKSDFVLFPEFLTMQLMSIENEPVKPHVAIEHMTEYTEQVKNLFQGLALKYNINIIAGSHPTKVGDAVRNISYICLRDGTIHEQAKIHPTPDEKYWWNIEGGDSVKVINTDCGPIGVLICYDSEFPELTRHLVNQGINILFVPFLTDSRQGYCRVRYCCQARAVENQIYVAMAGNVGNLPRVHNIDIQYAQSCILTPCDFPFARDGIAADTTPNVEMVAFADLRLDSLIEARNSGAVQNLKDRRHDLYSVTWHKNS